MPDNNRLSVNGSGLGCGVFNMTGISGYPMHDLTIIEQSCQAVIRHFWGRWGGNSRHEGVIVLFSDNTQRPIGQAIADYIVKHKLGAMVETPPTRNFNYPNDPKHLCKVWCWSVDGKATKAHAEKLTAAWIKEQDRLKKEREEAVLQQKAIAEDRLKVEQHARMVIVQPRNNLGQFVAQGNGYVAVNYNPQL